MNYRTTLYFDCGILGEIKLLCAYDFEPGQREIMHPIDNAQEGFAEGVALTEAYELTANGLWISRFEEIQKNGLVEVEEDLLVGHPPLPGLMWWGYERVYPKGK